MRCKKCREYLHPYLDGELDGPRAHAVETHLRACAACREERDELRQLLQATGETLREAPAPDGFAEAVLAAVEPIADQRRILHRGFPTGMRVLAWLGQRLPAAARLPQINRRLAAGTALAGLALLGVTIYVAGMDARVGERNTLVIGQSQLAWYSPASLRVVAFADAERKPLPGAPVLLEARPAGGGAWRTLYQGETNELGSVDASFRLPEALEGEATLRVSTGAGRQRDVVTHPIRIERRARILLSTDKPLYQPAQMIRMRVLAQHAAARRPAAGEAVTFEALDPNGTRVFRAEATTSEWGIAAADFQLADEITHGRYQLVARIGEEETEKTVTVEPYVLPKFRVDATTERPYYAPGETVRGTVSANYFFGKPVSGGEVTVRLAAYDVEFTEFAAVRGRTDADGEFRFEVRLPARLPGHPLEQGDALIRLAAEVTDATGHLEQVTEPLPVSARPFRLAVVPEGGEPIPGLENLFYLVASYPDGTVARVEGTVTPEGGEPVAFATDATGIAEARLAVDRVPLRLTLAARDAGDRRLTEEREIGGDRYRDPQASVLLRTDQALYTVGETLTAEVLAAATYGTIYLDISREGQTVLTRTAELENGRARFSLDLADDLVGSLTLHAYNLTSYGSFTRDTRRVIVRSEGDLRVAVEASQEVYRPGEEARLSFRLTDAEGNPARGALGLSGVDESLFALREADPGLQRDYFAMERAILEPRYQDFRFDLPAGFEPAAVLRGGAEAEPRAAVVLAALEQPVEGTHGAGRFGRFGDWQVGFADAPAGLWVDSQQERLTRAWRLQETYFSFLFWTLLLLALALPAVSLVRRRAPWGFLIWLPLAAYVFLLGRAGWYGWLPVGIAVLGAVALGLAARCDRKAIAFTVAALLIGTGSYTLAEVMGRGAFYLGPRAVAPAFLAGGDIPLFELLDVATPAREGRWMQHAPPASMPSRAEDGKLGTTAPAPGPEPPRLRQFFPETLLWQPELITDDQGRAEFAFQVADSITSWRVSALASTLEGQLGSATHDLRVFQEFFIDLQLPLALTQNDRLSLPVAIHNYLEQPQEITIEMEQADWFELHGEAVRTLRIPGNDVSVVHFPLTAREFGKHELTVTGRSSLLADAMQREVEVLPDGEPVTQALADRLDGSASRTIEFPTSAIPGTERLWLRLHPGVFSQVLEGLEGLFNVPYG